jgi:hypothetical protein
MTGVLGESAESGGVGVAIGELDLAIVFAYGRVYLGALQRDTMGAAWLDPALELQVQVNQGQSGLAISHGAVPPCLLTGLMRLPLSASEDQPIYLVRTFPAGEAASLQRAYAQGLAFAEQLRGAASGLTVAPAGALGALDAQLGRRPRGRG